MPEALALVKRELGDDAVILGTRGCAQKGVARFVGASGVEITAAAGGDHAPSPNSPARRIGASPSSSTTVAQPYYEHLVKNEVAEELARRVADSAARTAPGRSGADPGVLRDVLRATIARMIPVAGGVELTPGRMRRVALVGPAGAGKTTTLAKLAAHFKLRMNKRVAILSLDMHRLGGDEQMKRYADIIGVEFKAAQTVAGVKDVLREFGDVDLLLVDTHGVSGRDRGHYVRLAAVLRAARPDEIHLVLPASMVAGVQARVAKRFGPLGVSRVVLTHLDETVGLGVVLNAIEKLEWGLSYVTDGETIPNHLTEACPDRLAELVLPAGA